MTKKGQLSAAPFLLMVESENGKAANRDPVLVGETEKHHRELCAVRVLEWHAVDGVSSASANVSVHLRTARISGCGSGLVMGYGRRQRLHRQAEALLRSGCRLTSDGLRAKS